MGRKIARAITIALALTLFAGTARAAVLDVAEQRFNLSPHRNDFLTVMSSYAGDTLDYNVALFFNWEAETLMFRDAAGNDDELLTGRLTADVLAAISLFEYASVGIVMPLYLHSMSGSQDANFAAARGGPFDHGKVEGFGWGDLRFTAKVRIFDATKTRFGLAVGFDLTVPSGKPDAAASEGGVTVMPRLIGDMNIDGWKVALNIGFKWREDHSIYWLDVGSEFEMRAAFAAPIIKDTLEAIAEGAVATRFDRFFDDASTDYLEGWLGLRYFTDFGLGVTVGGGAGALRAYGAPLYRIFAGVNYAPPLAKGPDTDGDGLVDSIDGCPTDPEDFDGFADEDGCPDLDNDLDGLPDNRDECPNEPEDIDGFEDANGCPDPDNDGDGILDVDDRCPNEAEDTDTFQDDDGCPDPDNDGDGILDPNDQCPNEAEDMDGCQDDDGCPEPGRVCVTEERLEILDKIYFETNRATIKPESFPILDEVAKVLIDNPHITKVRVDGHTDDVGRDKYNQRLSAKRARAVVKYLIRAGVKKGRLSYKGFGEAKPITGNDTPEGRARNRRVEFTILKQPE